MALSRTIMIGALAALTFTSGCMQGLSNPDNPNRRTQQGALAGAAAGALAGIVTGGDAADRRHRALAGALIGGGAGAAIGYRLDQQEAELRAQMGSNVGIVNTGDRLIVTMPQDILFATDSASLSGGLQSDLRTLAASLDRYPSSRVEVIGHTDNVGDAGYNQGLSQRRAQAVASVLISSGIPSSRISAIGRGETAPVSNNLTADGRAQNRRVEIVIIPLQ